MILNVYDKISVYTSDLIEYEIIEEKNKEEFIEVTNKEVTDVVFFDTADGVFTCFVWIKNKKEIKEFEVIKKLTYAWAHYCKIDDPDTLDQLKTCSILSSVIIKNLKNNK